MANQITLTVLTSKGDPISEGIEIQGQFYLEYQNTETSKTRISNILSEKITVTDNKGLAVFNLNTTASTEEFTKYWSLFLNEGKKGKFLIKSKIFNVPNKTYGLSSIIGFAKLTEATLDEKTKTYNFNDLNFENSLTVYGIDDNNLSLDSLETKFKQAEENYLIAKKEYEDNLRIKDTTNIFDKLASYEPDSWNKVITRMLEFEEGTLKSALRFAEKTNLTDEYRRLDLISSGIKFLRNKYNDITINDGEGIPYNR